MTLPPDWTSPLRAAEEVRAADRRAIEDHGIAGPELMERAARSLADAVMRVAPEGTVAIVCGKGNNGGDGLAAARMLREARRDVELFATCDPEEWSGDPAVMLERLGDRAPVPLLGGLPDGLACVVDCVLGTGASGAPRGRAAAAIEAIVNAGESGATVIACDIPSGVDASSGRVEGDAVTARMTVTFHAPKVGLFVRPGKARAGEIEVVDIGIPGTDGPWRVGLIDGRVVAGLAVRGPGDDKFAAGSVLVAGGSPGLTGAPLLASLGAARGGAGYVTAALPAALLSACDAVPEVMGMSLPDDAGSHCAAGVTGLLERSARAGAVVLGPGLGRAGQALEFAGEVARGCRAPLVVDADGLRAFAGRLGELGERSGPTILTPHEAEIEALLGLDAGDAASSRLEHARTAAREADAVVVLKGDDTLVASPEGDVAISEGGAPALATAGSGDVLAGLAGALLARGADPFRAAAAAVRIHVEAGRLAARHGVEGTIAGDIAGKLPEARAALAAAGDGR